MGGNIVSNLLNTLVSWVAPAAMIILIVFLVKDVKNIIKGEGNIGRVLVKVLCIFLIVGVMYATTGFSKFGGIFKGVVDKTVTEQNLPQIGK